ncbi:hypothetical protein L596_009036 [Steinernema carpocapsae]|uniref:BTB domain-containing protein n=1 Tax=Steinernema carpocapsae TaxID=34508 RepID=A0A4V6A6G9_STECR|nr:hypothetical protein L596_009036 [Steinernema carpocapsae]
MTTEIHVVLGTKEHQVNGYKCKCAFFSENSKCHLVSCEPAGKKNATLLWSIEASGSFFCKGAVKESQSYGDWNGIFHNGCVKLHNAYNHARYEECTKEADSKRGDMKLKIVSCFEVDLADGANELIADPANAVGIKIGETTLWVDKKKLSHNSGYFSTLFSSDQFKENEEGFVILEDVDLEVFKLYLLFIHEKLCTLDEHTLVPLFAFAHYVHDVLVLKCCESYLKAGLGSLIHWEDAIYLATHFGLKTVLVEILRKMPKEDVKKFCKSEDILQLDLEIQVKFYRRYLSM